MLHGMSWVSRVPKAGVKPTPVPFPWLYVLAALFSSATYSGEATWLLVDTARATLSVMQDQKTLEVFDNVSLGRDGISHHRRKGEDKTPLGVYRISWIETHTRFHRFFGLNYPTIPQAYRAWTRSIIDERTYRRILEARRNRRLPAQDTALGGNIGIHGLGGGDPWIHAHLHWTNGCIALTNEQIDRLSLWIGKGTQVIIR